MEQHHITFSPNNAGDDTHVLATYRAYNPAAAARRILEGEYAEYARTGPYSDGVHDIILTACVRGKTARPVTF